MTSPIGDARAPFDVGPGIRWITHDLDPEQSVGEVAVVEGESEVAFGGGAVAGEIGVHLGFGVEEIRVFTTSHNPLTEESVKG